MRRGSCPCRPRVCLLTGNTGSSTLRSPSEALGPGNTLALKQWGRQQIGLDRQELPHTHHTFIHT